MPGHEWWLRFGGGISLYTCMWGWYCWHKMHTEGYVDVALSAGRGLMVQVVIHAKDHVAVALYTQLRFIVLVIVL